MIAASLAALAFLAPGPNVISHDWSGYAWTSRPHTYRQISATFTIPTALCKLDQSYGTILYETGEWVGLDGYNNGTVEQTGISQSCDPWGYAEYNAWYQMFPHKTVYRWIHPQPGQMITLSVAYNSATRQFIFHNGDWTVTKFAPSSIQRESAEVIIEAPGNQHKTLPTCPFAPFSIKTSAYHFGIRHRITLKDLYDGSTITPGPFVNGQFVATWRWHKPKK